MSTSKPILAAAPEALRTHLLAMLACVGVLAFMGLAAGVSAAPPGEAWSKMGMHCIHLALGLGSFLLCFSTPLESFRRIAPVMVVVVFLVLLAMKLIPGFGHESHAATRWVAIGPILLQPSVFLQFLWPAVIASWAARDPLRLTQARQVWRIIICLGVISIPILLQPDLGSVVILCGATGLILLFAGTPLVVLKPLVMFILAALVAMLFLFDHVDSRISDFISGEPGFQLQRAQEAFAAGGLTGVGPGQGILKNGFLPEGDTDFILALLAEEWGLFGTMLVWSLFVAFTLLGMRVARRAKGRYGSILMASAVLMISMQAALNMAVVTGIVPPKGLPLPFVSRGGSSILSLSALLGLAVRAVLEKRRSKVPVSELIQWTESNAPG